MPFTSVKQEFFMRRNKTSVWRKWVRKYGHHPDYKGAVKSAAVKSGKVKAKRKRKAKRGGNK